MNTEPKNVHMYMLPEDGQSEMESDQSYRSAELSQAQAHGPSEAGRGWSKWDRDGVRDVHRRGGERER